MTMKKVFESQVNYAKRKGPGRPCLGRVPTVPMQFRLEPPDRQIVEDLAAAAGVPVGTWIRWVVEGHLRDDKILQHFYRKKPCNPPASLKRIKP